MGTINLTKATNRKRQTLGYFTVVTICMMVATNAVAQCEEIKGVVAGKVRYYEECSPNGTHAGWKNNKVKKLPKIGYSFKNMNNCQVTIEAAMWKKQEIDEYYANAKKTISHKILIPEQIEETRTLVLEAGEEFIWEVGFNTNRIKRPNSYYLKFKAFKCP